MKHATYKKLSLIQKKALDEAERIMSTAYNPYSNYFVGAALYTSSGNIISGSNVENAAPWATICAERSAIFRANAMRQRSFAGIAVIARSGQGDISDVTAPCGGCRQVLYEFSQISGNDLEIILSTTKKDTIVITTISELFPLPWGPKDLGINLDKYK